MTEADTIAAADAPRTRASLAAELRALGLVPGDIVLVHSAMSKLGWVAGGPVAVIEALIDAVGPAGSIAMPAHSGQLSDPAHWQNPPVPAHWIEPIRAQMPAYDPRITPTRGMGAIAELFRTWPAAHRSAHPALSFAALGPAAEAIVADHALEDPLGDRSPLARLYDLDAKILLLGVGFDNCTALHLAECRAWPDWEREDQGAPMLIDGVRQWVRYRAPQLGDSENFTTLGHAFAHTVSATSGRVGSTNARLMSLAALVDFAVDRWRKLPPGTYA